MAVSPNTFAALNTALKINYAPFAEDLIKADSPFYKMIGEEQGFNTDLGGQKLEWPFQLDRGMNVGARSETDYLPGLHPSDTNDDIDPVTPIIASKGRKYLYADASFTLQQMADVHKKYEQIKGWGYSKHIKDMQDDFRMFLEKQILGDGTGVLGVVSAVSHSGGITTITLQPASTISDHGVHGTQRLLKNQKISFIRATHWSTNRRTAQCDSNVAGTGLKVFKVLSATGPHDVGASPQITVSGNLTASTALAAGDIVVEAKSRSYASGGGNSGTEADLTLMDGLFSEVDDGTISTSYANLSRTTYPELKSIVDLSATGRALSWKMLQVIFDKLRRRFGNEGIPDDFFLLTEPSVKTGYVAADGEAAKRYIQDSSAKTLLSGFDDVSMAFVGNDRLLPWLGMSTVPYGHGLLLRKKQMRMMWDVRPGVMEEDGLMLRQVTGKPVFYVALRAYGNFLYKQPFGAAKISGLTGSFSA